MESLELVQGLFLEWFLFDRQLTSWLKTPAELYIKFPKTRLKKSEREIAESLTKSIFGLFEVLDARSQEDCLEIKRFGGDERWSVRDVAGSRSMKKGDILFTRLIPCPGVALLSGWCAGYPGHQKEFREAAEQTRRKMGHIPLFHPRDVLNLFAPRIR